MTHRLRLIYENMGFLMSKEDETKLIEENPLQKVLVRCGNKRFTCSVQDVSEMVDAINATDDYVRDISVFNN